MKKGKKLLAVALTATLSLSAFTGCGFLDILDQDIGTESLEYTLEETQQKLKTISNSGGLEIKVKFYAKESGSEDENGETTFGMKDGVYWNISGDNGMAYVISSDKTQAYTYSYDGDEWSYSYKMEISNDDLSSIEGYFGLSTWLYFGHAYDGMLQKSGTTKVAGRDCYVYKYSLNLIVEKMEYTLTIDKETGATMKYDLGASVGGESVSTGFEISSFKTSGVTAPKLPDPVIKD